MNRIELGKIVNVVGLKGEVKVYNFSDGPDTYEAVDYIYLVRKDMKGEIPKGAVYKKYTVEKVRTQKDMVILKLAGVNNRTDADMLREFSIYVDEEQLPELPEGEFYIRDLIGMGVYLTEDGKNEYPEGKYLGTVADVIQNTAQDIIDVKTDDGKHAMIPFVDEFVTEINEEDGKITVKLIEGIL